MQEVKEESDHDCDPSSLEFEEDCYLAFTETSETPSFDIDVPDGDKLFILIDESDDDTEISEDLIPLDATVFSLRTVPKNQRRNFLAKLKQTKRFFKLLLRKDGPPTELSPEAVDNELLGLSPEEQEKQKEQWAKELQKVEEEIHTLREVLSSKIKVAQELKRKLGHNVWREFEDDMLQSFRNVKDSNIYHAVEEKVEQISKAVADAPIYQKTESVIKATTEKTTSILGGLGSGISSKIGQLKNSESFRSFEEKLGSAYENVKTKVASRSSSMQSFDEALRETEARRRSTTATTPTISEEHPA